MSHNSVPGLIQCHQPNWGHYQLFIFLSVYIEILTPRISQVHPTTNKTSLLHGPPLPTITRDKFVI